MSDARLLVGNSLGVLVAACELARSGRAVTLLTDGKALGGHFGGIRIEGHAFDIGMVLLEKVSPPPDAAADALRTYTPARRNDWTRFGNLAGDWLDAQLPLRRTPTPTTRVQGRVGPDYLIANRLDLLRHADCAAPALLPRDDPRHAAHKNHGRAYEHLSYAEAARFNHGDAVQARYIEPFVRKLFDVSSDGFLARYHRAGWLPLYYPETLAAALRGESAGLPEYPFHTTETGFVGELVAQLHRQLADSPHVRLVEQPLQSLGRNAGAWLAHTADGSAWTSTTLALGLPVERCLALSGVPAPAPPPAASVALMFCLVRSDAIGRGLGCEMVVDDDHAAYRASDQDALAGLDPQWHRVVIEASPRRLAELAAQTQAGQATAETVLENELRSLLGIDGEGAVRVLKHMTARNALPLPTAAALPPAQAAGHTKPAAQPRAAQTRAVLGYGVASFNDQIVQGLKIAEELT